MKAIFLVALAVLVSFCSAHLCVNQLLNINSAAAVKAWNADITLTADPASGLKNGDWVTVAWANVPNPSDDDWIGAYSQTPFNLTSAPAKFKMCNTSSSHSSGSGQMQFRLVNMRSSYTFVLFRGLTKPQALAVSNVVEFTNPNEPLQARLSLTESGDTIRLMWTTRDAKQPTVKWGTVSGQYTESAPADSVTYSADMLCGAPATTIGWMDPGLLHTAYMKGLQPSQRYFYIYGDDAFGWSAEHTLTAPPQPGQGAFTMVAFGDMGKAELDGSLEHWEELPSLNTTRLITQRLDSTDLLLHIGDISYAVGYSAQWDAFHDQIEPIASRVPYMTCIGNHERDYPDSQALFPGTDSGGECGVPYEMRFPKPQGDRDQPWYSFDYGLAHVVLMSTEHDFTQGSTQLTWLAADLAAVNRTRTPWIIFAGHRPMYIDSMNWEIPGGDQPVAALLRRSLESLLLQYKVDLCLWGHHHSYQRTCPVYQEKCQPQAADGSNTAPVHVVIGMAGMGLSQNIYSNQPTYFEYVNVNEYGFTTIAVNSTALHMQYFSDRDGGLRDAFTLVKPAQ